MPALVTVTKTGNSATIVLPSELRRANGIRIGDQVELVSRPDGIIELRKVKEGGRTGSKHSRKPLISSSRLNAIHGQVIAARSPTAT